MHDLSSAPSAAYITLHSMRRMWLPHYMRPQLRIYVACLLHIGTQLLNGVQLKAVLTKYALAGTLSVGRTHSSNQETCQAAQKGTRIFVQVTNIPQATFVLPKEVQLTDEAINAARRIGAEVCSTLSASDLFILN